MSVEVKKEPTIMSSDGRQSAFEEVAREVFEAQPLGVQKVMLARGEHKISLGEALSTLSREEQDQALLDYFALVGTYLRLSEENKER